MFYIQEIDKPKWYLKLFNILKIEKDKIILPFSSEEINEKNIKGIVKKVENILLQSNSYKIVLSKELKKNIGFKNALYASELNIDIIEGKWLFEVLSYKLLDYVIEKKKMNKDEIKISVLVNDLNEINIENIKKIINKYKKVNIVTNHIEKFKKIEEYYMNKEGILIDISNNKQKSISKTDIVLNIDFPNDKINQYNINEKAIIINIKNNIKINSKRFNGICLRRL